MARKKAVPNGRAGQDKLVKLHHLMRWTLRAFYWLDESLQNIVEDAGWPRFSHTQTMVILAIGEGVTKSSDLGRILGISRQAIHQVITELISKGLVVIKDDPDDKRSKILGFDHGADTLRLLTYNAVERIEREVEERLGKKAFKAMIDGISADWGAPVTAADVKAAPAKLKRRPKKT